MRRRRRSSAVVAGVGQPHTERHGRPGRNSRSESLPYDTDRGHHRGRSNFRDRHRKWFGRGRRRQALHTLCYNEGARTRHRAHGCATDAKLMQAPSLARQTSSAGARFPPSRRHAKRQPVFCLTVRKLVARKNHRGDPQSSLTPALNSFDPAGRACRWLDRGLLTRHGLADRG